MNHPYILNVIPSCYLRHSTETYTEKEIPVILKNGRGVNRGPFKSSPYQHTGSLSVLIVDLGKQPLLVYLGPEYGVGVQEELTTTRVGKTPLQEIIMENLKGTVLETPVAFSFRELEEPRSD